MLAIDVEQRQCSSVNTLGERVLHYLEKNTLILQSGTGWDLLEPETAGLRLTYLEQHARSDASDLVMTTVIKIITMIVTGIMAGMIIAMVVMMMVRVTVVVVVMLVVCGDSV